MTEEPPKPGGTALLENMTSGQQPIFYQVAPTVAPMKEEEPKAEFSGYIEFSTCGQLALAAPFFSLWMDLVRIGIIVGVM